MSLFKRSARIGSGGVANGTKDPAFNDENEPVLQELVDALTVLVAASGFLESEKPLETRDARTRMFT